MLLRLFNTSLQRRPLLTQIVASGIISGAGDVMCQFVIERKSLEQYDWKRTGRFFVLASSFIAPIVSRWFRFLETRVHIGPKKLVPLTRVAIDQTVMSPAINAGLLIVLRLLEGFSINTSVEKMRRDWWIVYSNSLFIWPFVQTVNFYFVPLHYRVILVQIVSLFWNCFISYKTQAKPADQSLQEY